MLPQRLSRLLCSFLAICCLFSVQAGADSHYNATTDQDEIVCAYQLSGQYGLLPRLLFYVLIVFTTVGSSHVWLIAGALASALIYSGTAVIHAFILAIGSKPLYDLDVVGVWAILSVSWFAIQPMFGWSRVIPKVQSRTIFRFGGSPVAFGAIMSMAALLRNYPSEPECRSHNGDLLRDIWGTKDPAFNCSYACFNNQQILRSPTDITILSKKRAFGEGWVLVHISLGISIMFSVVFGILTYLLVPDQRTRTWLGLDAVIAINQSDESERTDEVRNNEEEEPPTRKMPHSRYACSGISLVFLPWATILNEVYLLQDGGLPCTESLYSIGQWAPWVGVALALVAALVVRWKQPTLLAMKKILGHMKAEVFLRRNARSAKQTSQQQHAMAPSQDASDVRPQQASEMTTQDSRRKDFGIRNVMTEDINTDLEAGLSDGSMFLLRKCHTL